MTKRDDERGRDRIGRRGVLGIMAAAVVGLVRRRRRGIEHEREREHEHERERERGIRWIGHY